ncbi:hypothetical protein SCUCBS95973_004860 [Sporothrix curviconia]|uniref:Gfo/Idh/MocA-like oxidoreductase N-terminal domain-containing protein n=1 Tax=Sporothrix curviconia TaxID=1260050 RepID=A0ABP0BTN1_9PEZI
MSSYYEPRHLVTIAIIGAGHRGRTYADYAFDNPALAKVVAVAEPSKHRRAATSTIPVDMQFRSWLDMMVGGLPYPVRRAHGHVLRCSPYNRAIKAVIDSGALGEIINIQHIEPVGNEHFAHSYVRDSWHKEATSSFALMAKCCHDIDILSFYLSGLRPAKAQLFGSLGHFKNSRKPAAASAAVSCLDCAHESSCIWSAEEWATLALPRAYTQ